mmetsp:Transcript_21003/g.37444  ORF Transcript_21003/g.37444 Transcript_21003/m.37444 type:complete len:112 (+) Transcript_21003:272-607(+)
MPLVAGLNSGCTLVAVKLSPVIDDSLLVLFRPTERAAALLCKLLKCGDALLVEDVTTAEKHLVFITELISADGAFTTRVLPLSALLLCCLPFFNCQQRRWALNQAIALGER